MAERSEDPRSNTTLALIGLVIGFAVGLILAWIYWLERQDQPSHPSPSQIAAERITLEPDELAIAEDEPFLAAEPEPEPDDLTLVEGIGPKMSSVLDEAGITTFHQLASSEPEMLKQLLRDHGLQFADPTTWPEQAALAAVGAWGALEELQQELSRGRRVA